MRNWKVTSNVNRCCSVTPKLEHAYSADLSKCASDVLVLQTPMQITVANTGQVQAKLIVECVPRSGFAGKSGVGQQRRCGDSRGAGSPRTSAAVGCRTPVWYRLPSRVSAPCLRRTAGKLMPEIRRSAAIWKTDLSRAVLSLAIERRANQIRRAAM